MLADTGYKAEWIAEPPNGWIKNVLGLRQFSLRGLHWLQAEWKWVCMALNHAAHGNDAVAMSPLLSKLVVGCSKSARGGA